MLVFWSGWQDKQPEDTQPSWHCSRHRQGDPQDTAKKGVNYAKAWLDHSFIFPGLVRSVKWFHFGCDQLITRGQSTTISLCIGPFSAW